MTDELRHVTVLALNEVFPWLGSDAMHSVDRKGCDWEALRVVPVPPVLGEMSAWRLVRGGREPLPTCPACAALLDLAFELRGTKEAA